MIYREEHQLIDYKDVPHGLYVIFWKNGGVSLGCIGGKYNGDRWLVCSNWISDIGKCTEVLLKDCWSKIHYLKQFEPDAQENVKLLNELLLEQERLRDYYDRG